MKETYTISFLAIHICMNHELLIPPVHCTGLRKNGSVFPLELNVSKISDSTEEMYIGVLRDITLRQQNEQALILAKNDAEKANRAKSEFLSSMSHELRTPLNAILGFGQILEFHDKDPLSDYQKKCVENILKGGNYLLELIDEILDLAKAESGNIDLTIGSINTKSICEECCELVRKQALNREIDIKIVCNTIKLVTGDYARTRQILLNLLSNAIKYNQHKGHILVSINEMENQNIRISVQDTGLGIPLNLQDGIFEPFNRLGAESTNTEGTGIGLTITKRLVNAMNGQIGFESEENHGSTFWFELPIDHQRNGDQKVKNSIANHSVPESLFINTLSILYIEDNRANLELLEAVVSNLEGPKLISAYNAEQGIIIAKDKKPDLIFMDINLPGMNGAEALQILKEDKNTQSIPVVAISASAMQHDIEAGQAAGFDDYITKPIDLTKIVEIIQSYMDS